MPMAAIYGYRSSDVENDTMTRVFERQRDLVTRSKYSRASVAHVNYSTSMSFRLCSARINASRHTRREARNFRRAEETERQKTGVRGCLENARKAMETKLVVVL